LEKINEAKTSHTNYYRSRSQIRQKKKYPAVTKYPLDFTQELLLAGQARNIKKKTHTKSGIPQIRATYGKWEARHRYYYTNMELGKKNLFCDKNQLE
jgi:hypothetical protein